MKVPVVNGMIFGTKVTNVTGYYVGTWTSSQSYLGSLRGDRRSITPLLSAVSTTGNLFSLTHCSSVSILGHHLSFLGTSFSTSRITSTSSWITTGTSLDIWLPWNSADIFHKHRTLSANYLPALCLFCHLAIFLYRQSIAFTLATNTPWQIGFRK